MALNLLPLYLWSFPLPSRGHRPSLPIQSFKTRAPSPDYGSSIFISLTHGPSLFPRTKVPNVPSPTLAAYYTTHSPVNPWPQHSHHPEPQTLLSPNQGSNTPSHDPWFYNLHLPPVIQPMAPGTPSSTYSPHPPSPTHGPHNLFLIQVQTPPRGTIPFPHHPWHQQLIHGHRPTPSHPLLENLTPSS